MPKRAYGGTRETARQQHSRRCFSVATITSPTASVAGRSYAVHNRSGMNIGFSHQLAAMADLPELKTLMTASISALIGAYLDPARTEASLDIMGVDTQLIEDGTYFVAEAEGRIAGCGGWSRRATLFGGDHSTGRSVRLLDPGTEPARVRAMYTHPDFVRRGVGRLVLSLCEEAAAREGFRSLALVATVAGEPLYSACGFSLVERIDVPTTKGVTIPCARMTKPIADIRFA